MTSATDLEETLKLTTLKVGIPCRASKNTDSSVFYTEINIETKVLNTDFDQKILIVYEAQLLE